MNLIEQLGGYEAARDSLQWLIEHDNDYVQEESALYHSCLEHRRANNIFEVLDKVVLVGSEYNDVIWSVVDVSSNGELIGIIGKKEFGTTPCFSSLIRHATDEEIEAGHRL